MSATKILWVPMSKRFMAVPVRMRLANRPLVVMLVVLVMSVAMFMLECIMVVAVGVAFSQVQPKSSFVSAASATILARHNRGLTTQIGACLFLPMGIAISPKGDMPKHRVQLLQPRTSHVSMCLDFSR